MKYFLHFLSLIIYSCPGKLSESIFSRSNKYSMIYYLVIICVSVLSTLQNTVAQDNREMQNVIHEKWEMLTDTGFGYSLHFNNEDSTFMLDYHNEGIAVIHPRIKGTFLITEGKARPVITLVFKDFKINYYYKLPSHYYATLPEDQLTEKEVKMCNVKGYVDKTTLFVKNIEIINKNVKLPFYYDDLKAHFFVQNDR